MASHAVTKSLVAVAALAIGTATALVVTRDGGEAPEAAEPVVEPAQSGASGQSLAQETVAVSAVQAHLRTAGVQGLLADIRLFPRPAPDEVIVCGMVPMQGGQPVQVVARVILGRATSAAPGPAAQNGPTGPRIGDTMVVMEAGPGLGRGGSQEGPALRYCREPAVANPVVASPGGEVTRTGEPDGASPPADRVVVVTPARIRAEPSRDGAILATTQRQQRYVVLGRAPGGWIQLGDGDAALGWAHSSLFAPAP